MIDFNINSLIIVFISIFFGFMLAYWRLRKRVARLKSLAYSDDLGIYNHRELDNKIKNLIHDNSINSFVLVLIDIDHFKSFNDNLGYSKADDILIEFIKVIKNFTRDSDLFFRYKHGDEFALIFKNVNIEQAKEIANRLRRIIAYHPFNIDNCFISLTISMGITSKAKHDSVKSITDRAEEALHEAKLTKNTVVLIGK